MRVDAEFGRTCRAGYVFDSFVVTVNVISNGRKATVSSVAKSELIRTRSSGSHPTIHLDVISVFTFRHFLVDRRFVAYLYLSRQSAVMFFRYWVPKIG